MLWVEDIEKKMPLNVELEYFLDHLDGKEILISNVHHGFEVVKTLVSASKQLLNWKTKCEKRKKRKQRTNEHNHQVKHIQKKTPSEKHNRKNK